MPTTATPSPPHAPAGPRAGAPAIALLVAALAAALVVAWTPAASAATPGASGTPAAAPGASGTPAASAGASGTPAASAAAPGAIAASAASDAPRAHAARSARAARAAGVARRRSKVAHAAAKRPPRLRIRLLRCLPVRRCSGPQRTLVRRWKVEVAGHGIGIGTRLVFRVRGKPGRPAGFRAVRGILNRHRHLFVRVPANAVGGRVRLLLRGRYSNSVIVHVRSAPPRTLDGARSLVPGTPSAFDGNGMWIWYVSRSQGGSPAAIAAQARAHGVRTIFVKSSDGTHFWPQFAAGRVAALKATGLRVCAWQFVYGDNPLGEARAGAQAVINGADCLVIDAEGAYEGKYAQAQRYIRALRTSIGATFPLGLTSFPYVDYHPALPYSVFLGPGGATFNLPQMYWKTIGTSVDANVAHTYGVNQVYQRPIYPLGQTYANPLPADVIRFRQLAAAHGARGVSWWDWQETTPAGWRALGAPLTPLPAASVPEPDWPVLKAGRRGKVGSRGDLVVWAQQHLIASGAAIRPDGDFGPATRRAVLAFQRDAELPATGVIDAATWPRLLARPVATPAWARRAGAAAGVASAAAVHGRNGPRSAWLPPRRNEIPPGPSRPPLR